MQKQTNRLIVVLTLSILAYACGASSKDQSIDDAGQAIAQGPSNNPGQGTTTIVTEGNPPANDTGSRPSESVPGNVGAAGTNPNQGAAQGHQDRGTAQGQGGAIAVGNAGSETPSDVPSDVTNTNDTHPEGQAGTTAVASDGGKEESGEDSKKPSWAGCPGKQPKPSADCSAEMTNTCYYGDVSCVCKEELWVCTDANGVQVTDDSASGSQENGQSGGGNKRDAGGGKRGSQSDAGGSGSQKGGNSSRGAKNGG
jgi:hypothetical protein